MTSNQVRTRLHRKFPSTHNCWRFSDDYLQLMRTYWRTCPLERRINHLGGCSISQHVLNYYWCVTVSCCTTVRGACRSEAAADLRAWSLLSVSLLNHEQINGSCVNSPQGPLEWPPPPPSSLSQLHTVDDRLLLNPHCWPSHFLLYLHPASARLPFISSLSLSLSLLPSLLLSRG